MSDDSALMEHVIDDYDALEKFKAFDTNEDEEEEVVDEVTEELEEVAEEPEEVVDEEADAEISDEIMAALEEGDLEEEEGEESADTADIQEQNKALTEQVEALTERLIAAEEKQILIAEKPVSELEVTQEEFDEAFSDREKFQAMLQKVEVHAYDRILQNLPIVTARLVARQAAVEKLTESFYKENPDLLPIRKYVGKVAAEIQAEKPTASLEDILDATKEKVRASLKLAAEKIKKKGRPGAFAQKGGVSRPAKKKKTQSSVMGEIEDMKKLLKRHEI